MLTLSRWKLTVVALAVIFGVLFTLPVGLRPAKDAYVPTDLVNAKNGRLYISTSGAVSVETGDGPFSNATSFTSLEGVTFPLLGN